MSGPATRLGRLLAIRKLNEDVTRRCLQLALASLAEVESAIVRQETALRESREASRAALLQGNRPEWLMSEAQAEAAGWNQQRLQTLLNGRAEASAEAVRVFLDSRSEHEQVRQLVNDAMQSATALEDRRAQSAADDWFLSRRERPKD